MSKVVGASWGVFLVIFGIVALGWVSYLLFVNNVERVEPKGFVFGYGLALGAIVIGTRRIRGQRPDPAVSPDIDDSRGAE